MAIRVGLICHSGFGGSVRIAVDLAEGLAGRGHQVRLLSRRPPLGRVSFAPGVAFHGLATSSPDPPSPRLDAEWAPGDLEAFSELVGEVARSSRLDVVHFHYAVPFAAVAMDLRHRLGRGAPQVIGTLHGTDVSTFGRRWGDGSDLATALAGVDALTTVSDAHARLASRVFGLGRPPAIIPNFVDVGRFRPLPSGGPGTNGRRPRIVHVSNFRPVKDPPAIARVFARVRRQVDAELWLVGEGELMPQVRRILREAAVGASVRYFGLTPRVEAILPHADLLLLTSLTESFGLVALEAAACGIPVVAPRVGGLPEVVLDGETGVLFDPGDQGAAVRAVLRVLGDRFLAARMSRAAAARARWFSRDLLVGRYEDLYRAVLSSQPDSGGALPPARAGSLAADGGW